MRDLPRGLSFAQKKSLSAGIHSKLTKVSPPLREPNPHQTRSWIEMELGPAVWETWESNLPIDPPPSDPNADELPLDS